MKINILPAIMLITFFSVGLVHAQEKLDNNYVDKKGRPIRYNIIKTNLFGLGIGAYELTYERKINQKFSAVMGLTLFGPSMISPLTIRVDGRDVDINYSSNGFTLSPEIRWYLGRHGSPRGYYFGLYVPIMHYKGHLKGNTIVNTMQQNQNVDVAVTGKVDPVFNFYGLGLSGGPQFIISSRVTLELYLNIAIGAYALKNLNYSYDGTSAQPLNTNLTPGNYTASQLQNSGISVENSSSYSYAITSNGSQKYLQATYHDGHVNEDKSGLIILPRLGFTVGYAFGK